jgi:hypothetical protein
VTTPQVAAPPIPSASPAGHASRVELLVASIVWLASFAGSLSLVWLWLPFAVDGGDPTLVSIVMLAPVLVVFDSLGWLLVRARPGNRVGWLLMLTALSGSGAFLGIALGQLLLESEPALAGGFGTLGVTLLIPTFLLPSSLLPLVFPDGRLPGPLWRIPVVILAAMLIVVVIGLGLTPGQLDSGIPPNPIAIGFLPQELRALASLLSAVMLVAGAVLGVSSVAVRFRRGRGDERQQVKWLLAASLVFVLAALPGFIGIDSDLLSLLGPLALALLPVAITLAVLRYRLYDIDRLISRSISYALLTAAIVGVFVLGNLGLQSALSGLTAGNTLAVAVSTLLAFAIAQPARRWIQGIVDRRFDRARVDAARAVAAFSARQRDRVDLAAIVADVQATSQESLRPTAIGVWLRGTSPRPGADA